jgi:GntR family transcriptional regulator
MQLALADTGSGVIQSSRYAAREGTMTNYQRVRKLILLRIDSRESGYLPGEKIPSSQQLSDELGVSVALINNVMRSLEEAGVIRGRPGLGRFVLERGNDDHSPVDTGTEGPLAE